MFQWSAEQGTVRKEAGLFWKAPFDLFMERGYCSQDTNKCWSVTMQSSQNLLSIEWHFQIKISFDVHRPEYAPRRAERKTELLQYHAYHCVFNFCKIMKCEKRITSTEENATLCRSIQSYTYVYGHFLQLTQGTVRGGGAWAVSLQGSNSFFLSSHTLQES